MPSLEVDHQAAFHHDESRQLARLKVGLGVGRRAVVQPAVHNAVGLPRWRQRGADVGHPGPDGGAGAPPRPAQYSAGADIIGPARWVGVPPAPKPPQEAEQRAPKRNPASASHLPVNQVPLWLGSTPDRTCTQAHKHTRTGRVAALRCCIPPPCWGRHWLDGSRAERTQRLPSAAAAAASTAASSAGGHHHKPTHLLAAVPAGAGLGECQGVRLAIHQEAVGRHTELGAVVVVKAVACREQG